MYTGLTSPPSSQPERHPEPAEHAQTPQEHARASTARSVSPFRSIRIPPSFQPQQPTDHLSTADRDHQPQKHEHTFFCTHHTPPETPPLGAAVPVLLREDQGKQEEEGGVMKMEVDANIEGERVELPLCSTTKQMKQIDEEQSMGEMRQEVASSTASTSVSAAASNATSPSPIPEREEPMELDTSSQSSERRKGRVGLEETEEEKRERERLLESIELTNKASLLQHRLALASFKTQHGWGGLTLGEVEAKLPLMPTSPSSPSFPRSPTASSSTHPFPSSRDSAPPTPQNLRKRKSVAQLSLATSPIASPLDQPISPTSRTGPPPSPGFARVGWRAAQSPTRVSFASTTNFARASVSLGMGEGAGSGRRLSNSEGTGPRVAYASGSPYPSPRKRNRTEESSLGVGRRVLGEEDGRAVLVEGGGRRPAMEGTRGMGRRRVMSSGSMMSPSSPESVRDSPLGRFIPQSPSLGQSVFRSQPSPQSIQPSPDDTEREGLARKKARSKSHSSILTPYVRHNGAGLEEVADESELDAANALTRMWGSSPREFSPSSGGTVAESGGRGMMRGGSGGLFASSGSNGGFSKPRSQSFAYPMAKEAPASPSPVRTRPLPLSWSLAKFAAAPLSPTQSRLREDHAAFPPPRPKDVSRFDTAAEMRGRDSQGTALEDESSDEDKRAAELMIFLAQSPSPARKVEKRREVRTPGGVGRVLFEETRGLGRSPGSPSRGFERLVLSSPARGGERNARGGSSGEDDVEILADEAKGFGLRTKSSMGFLRGGGGEREVLGGMDEGFPLIQTRRGSGHDVDVDMDRAGGAQPLSATTSSGSMMDNRSNGAAE